MRLTPWGRAASAALAMLVGLPCAVAAEEDGAPQRSRSLLILGGTGFTGPHITALAQERGWKVTTFTRGRRPVEAAEGAEHLLGDRDPEIGDGLKALEGRIFDAVIDTSGHVPRHVRASAELLAPHIGQYIFISSGSVYADTSTPGMDEDGPLVQLEEETEDYTGAAFGPLKALCEQAVRDVMGERATIVRPGLIVGPRDWSDRFTYWVDRVARGGKVLAPDSPDTRVMFIDGRDLAQWLIHLCADRITGTFNAIGPEGGMPFGKLLEACREVSGSDAELVWVGADFLEREQVHGWTDLPLWLPPDPEMAGFHSRSIRRALDAGLTFRPIEETVRDTLEWWRQQPAERRARLRFGLKPEREAELLAKWEAEAAADGGAGG